MYETAVYTLVYGIKTAYIPGMIKIGVWVGNVTQSIWNTDKVIRSCVGLAQKYWFQWLFQALCLVRFR